MPQNKPTAPRGTAPSGAGALLLSQLDPDQYAAATAPLGPVCILAGAGTGKTRTITHRIHHLIDQGFVQPQKILAVTFTKRAAGEMRDRLDTMGTPGVQARTFHSAALRQLRYFWPQVAGDMPWQLIENKFSLVGRAVRGAGMDSSTETIRDVMSEIEWAKASLITPAGYAEAIDTRGRVAPAPAEKISQAYQNYEDSKATPEGMLLDYDDLLLHTAGAMENSRAVAEEFRAQYRSFVVDEYQDVTPLQQRVLDAWLGARDDLTVVGDANQTIYSFTGATPDFLMNFSRKYDHATVVKLQRDYRSTPEIVSLANDVIGKARGRIAASKLQLIGQRDHGPEPRFSEYDDESMEARVTARHIKRLIDGGTPASEIAILYRINAQSAVFEQALGEAGVPYQVHGGAGFYQRPEVRQAVAELIRAGRNGRDGRGSELIDIVAQIISKLGLTKEEPEGAQARERWHSLKALSTLCADLVHAHPELTMQGLLGQLRTRQEAQHPPTLQGVTLASLHAAKGLEWDAVFLVGMCDGTLPIQHALKKGDTAEEVEEERRLLYVGITRARSLLEISWALARQEGGRKTRKRSRFLDEIDFPGLQRTLTTTTAPTKRSRAASRCKQCNGPLTTNQERILGTCAKCPADLDDNLIAVLKAWRLETSREMSVPAYVIFSDATLISIAHNKPTTIAELLEIPGIGPVKAQHYGTGVLEIVQQF